MKIFFLSVFLAFIVSSCRQSSKPVPQTGPILGSWTYIGSDLQKPQEGIIRSFVIGDHTWWVPKEVEFFGSGEVTSGYKQTCYFSVKNDRQLELDCHQGKVIIEYSISGPTLTLNLQGQNTALSGGNPHVSFKRLE